ncbi:MAG: ester cyclase [Anaerolineales bacterium]
MSSEEVKTRTFNTFMDAFNNGNLSALDTICAPNMVDHSTAAASGQPNDLEGFKTRVNGHRIGIPDLHFSIMNMIIEGELMAFQWEMNGTNTGPYMGRPPSGNPIRIVGMNMERLENGKIVEHWSYPDKLAALQQIGAIPS